MGNIFKRILNFCKTINSLVIINLYIFIEKNLYKEKKIILFYFPVKSYQENLIELIDKLKENKNYKILLGYNFGTSKEIKKYKNSFFLNLGYLKYLFDLDIFISSYIVYTLPKAKNRIYINHDIYDAPMVSRDKEINLTKSFFNYDHIFTSSNITSNMMKNKINQLYDKKNYKKKPNIINTGYLKLDHIYKKINNQTETEDSILLAPTKSSVFLEYDMSLLLEDLIEKIIKNQNFNLIYRPHPGDLIDPIQKKRLFELNNKFKTKKNYIFDINTSYVQSYKRAKIMITDFSGTAYTFAFCKLRPIIFFSKNERMLLNSDLSELNYFKDREQIGVVESKIDNIENSIIHIKKNLDFFSKNILELRNNRIEHFNEALNQNLLNIKKIISNE